jgi:hypothetical protein
MTLINRRTFRLLPLLALLVGIVGLSLFNRPAQAYVNDSFAAADWETPPMYYRPSANNLVAGDNDPINVIVYGPSLTASQVNQALFSAGAMVDQRTEGFAWVDNNGTWQPSNEVAPIFGSLVQKCTNPISWAPADGVTPGGHIGAAATTVCPALYADLASSTFPLYRNHTRYWAFTSSNYSQFRFPRPVANSQTVYVAASYTENLVRVQGSSAPFNVYAPLPATVLLACGKAHCLTDYNRARNTLVRDMLRGSATRNWRTKEHTFVSAPIHVNRQGPAVTNPYNRAFQTDGKVSVVCLDPAGTTVQSSLSQYNGKSFCDLTPAARPVAFNYLFPLNGSGVVGGTRVALGGDVYYSDSTRRISSVVFKLNGKGLDGSPKSQTLTASVSGPYTEGSDGSPLGLAYETNANWTVPTNWTGQTDVRIEICDNLGSCWVRKNLRYFISQTATPTPTPTPQTATVTVLCKGEYTSTGLNVVAGQQVKLESLSGLCYYYSGGPSSATSIFVYIGDTLARAGTGTFTATQSGAIRLRFGDACGPGQPPGCYSDNTGSGIQARVTVTSPSAGLSASSTNSDLAVDPEPSPALPDELPVEQSSLQRVFLPLIQDQR